MTNKNNLRDRVTLNAHKCDQPIEGFSDRLKFLIGESSLRGFAQKSGCSEGVLRAYLLNKSEPNMQNLIALAKAGGASIDWLATGREDKSYQAKDLAIKPLQFTEGAVYSLNPTASTADAWQDFELIPFYDIEISAGHGSFAQEEFITSHMAFRKDWLQQRCLQPKHCVLAKGRGDSMEKTIYHGDMILIDKSINTIVDDAIYVLRVGMSNIIKRVQQSVDGSLTIISDNGIYPRQTIQPQQAADLQVIGRVKWYSHDI